MKLKIVKKQTASSIDEEKIKEKKKGMDFVFFQLGNYIFL